MLFDFRLIVLKPGTRESCAICVEGLATVENIRTSISATDSRDPTALNDYNLSIWPRRVCSGCMELTKANVDAQGHGASCEPHSLS